MMKLNIGGGFTYCSGFTNVDICREYLVSWLPAALLYVVSGSRNHHPFSRFAEVINSNPIHHDVRKTLPFKNDSIEEIYTSHLLEHLTKEDGLKFISEMLRVLRPSGLLRIVTPDFDKSTKDILFNEFSDEWSRHKYVWGYDELKAYYPTLVLCCFREGQSTALALDSMPEQSMYLEMVK